MAEFALELVALGIAAVAIGRGWRPAQIVRQDRGWAIALCAVASFPLLQLIPLPPGLWSLLPGRGPALAALQAAGEGRAWTAWSMLPDGGVAAFCSLLPALAMALLTARLPLTARVHLVGWVALLGGVAAIVGMAQFMRGEGQPLSFYAYVHGGFGIGFFANRNAEADLIAIALTAMVLLAHRHRERLAGASARAAIGAAGLVLLAGGLATGSRMGVAMLLGPVALAVGLAGRRGRWLTVGLVAAAIAVVAGGTALDRVVGRVHDAGNRTEIWADSVYVARSVAPWGAGVGSFVPLYAAAERLDMVQPTYANRAHNDYLELAIEGGVPALLLLGALMVFVSIRVKAGWRSADPDERLLARFVGLSLLVLALHSAVDYPLRTITLISLAGLAVGGLAFVPPSAQKRVLGRAASAAG